MANKKEQQPSGVKCFRVMLYLASNLSQYTEIRGLFPEEHVNWILSNIGKDVIYTSGVTSSVNLKFYATVTFEEITLEEVAEGK